MPDPHTDTPKASTAGARRRMGHYQTPAGRRHVVAQRINDRVALIDEPAPGSDGRVYLIERHVTSMQDVHSITAAYVQHSTDAGMPGVLAHRELFDRLTEATS